MTTHFSVGAMCCLFHGKIHNALSRINEVESACGVKTLGNTGVHGICDGKFHGDIICNYDLSMPDLEIRDGRKVTCPRCIKILKKNGF